MPQNDYAHNTKARGCNDSGLFFLGPTPLTPLPTRKGGMAIGLARGMAMGLAKWDLPPGPLPTRKGEWREGLREIYARGFWGS